MRPAVNDNPGGSLPPAMLQVVAPPNVRAAAYGLPVWPGEFERVVGEMLPAAVAGPPASTASPPNPIIDAIAPTRKRLVASARGTLNPPGGTAGDAIGGHRGVRPLSVLLRAQNDGRVRTRDAQGGDHRDRRGEQERRAGD